LPATAERHVPQKDIALGNGLTRIDGHSFGRRDERAQVRRSELELEGELDGTGAADLVERVEAAIRAAGAQAAGQRLRRVAEQRVG
jgi:hypothetical protein